MVSLRILASEVLKKLSKLNTCHAGKAMISSILLIRVILKGQRGESDMPFFKLRLITTCPFVARLYNIL